MKKTIYDIKRDVINGSHFFDRKSLKFFGQTLKMFRVHQWKNCEGKYTISAPIVDSRGKYIGMTTRDVVYMPGSTSACNFFSQENTGK